MHHIPDDVFLIAARELAASVRDEDLEVGSLYPPLDAIREVSLRIAIGITKYAYCEGMSFFRTVLFFYRSKVLHLQPGWSLEIVKTHTCKQNAHKHTESCKSRVSLKRLFRLHFITTKFMIVPPECEPFQNDKNLVKFLFRI